LVGNAVGEESMYREGTPHIERVFSKQSLGASGVVVSAWYKLPENLVAHGVNGNMSGSGTLTLSYELAATPDAAYGVTQGNILAGATAAANSPFLRSLSVRPSAHVRFTLTETSTTDGLLINMFFIQTGRGA